MAKRIGLFVAAVVACFGIAGAAQAAATSPSTTTLSPNPTTAYTSGAVSLVTLTATVTAGATGTITFKDGATNLTCSAGNPVVLSGASATCVTNIATEGVHTLSATYSGDATFVGSSGTANVFVQNHAANTGTTYCNTGSISSTGQSNLSYANGSPYPSVIFIGDGVNADITNVVSTLSLKLVNFSTASGALNSTHMLLMSPDRLHAFDFFSNIGTTASAGNYIFQDGASQVPAGPISPGTYGPTANGPVPDIFTPGPPLPAPQLPASFVYAAPSGSSTFQTSFSGAAAHGAWSLYLYDAGGAGITATAAGGWCLTITTPPPPVLAITKTHTGTFTQGSTGTWNLAVQNNSATAAGATNGSTVTMTDTLPPGYTLSSITGASWNCASSTQAVATCTSTAVVAGAGGLFPVITLNVTIPANSPTSVTNTGRVFGGGDLTHTNSGNAAVSSDTPSVIQVPASITVTAGNNQNVAVGTAFPTNFSTTVLDAGSAAISGVTVTFTAPASGASGTFAGGTNVKTALTNASGLATATTYTANGTAGGPYNVGVAAGAVSNNFSETNLPGTATQMTANVGTTPQSATVSTAFANALAVTVKDALNNPVAGVNVTFTAPGSGASGIFSNSTATITVATNASGVAAAPFTANSTAGGYTVMAAASGLTAVNFSLTNNAATATSMTANAGTTPQSATVSTAFANALAVTVKDAGSNPVSGVNVTFTAPASGASGVFSNSTATITVATNASGVAAAPFTANSTAGGPYAVTAAASGLTTVNFSLTNTAGTATSMTANAGTTPQSATVSTAFTNALAVTVKDAGSNPVSGVNVTFTAPASGASGIFSNSTATITVATNASGVAAAPFTANGTAGGPYTVTAAATGLTPVNFSLTNTAGSATSMTANAGTTPQSTTVSTAFGTALAVTVKDSGSNPVSGVNVTFTAPASGASGIFSNSTATITVVTNVSGVAFAPFTANATTGGPYTVTAAASGLTTVNFSLTNTAGAASSMTANAGTTPQSATVSTAFGNALAVTVKDAGSNPVSGVNVTFTAPASGASGIFSNSTATITVATNASGVAAAPFTANSTAGGPYAVTAAASGLTTVNFLLTNTAGSATSMTANAGTTPQSTTISTAFSNALAVTVKDAGSNPVSGVNVTFTAPASGASGIFSNSTATITVATNASGIAAAPFTANGTAGGAYTVTAAATGLTPVNFSLTNTAGTATSMTANAGTTPQSTAVSTAFAAALAVTVNDAGSNPVSGVNVTFTAPASGASGVFSNTTTTITVATDASGVATAAFTANATVGGPYTVTAAASGLTTVNFSLTNTAGAATSMTANAGTTPQSAAISAAFVNPLAVTVNDAGSNPVSGVNVTFTAPASGASGVFSNGTATITVATNASGVAAAPFTANGTLGGPYTVTAAASGLPPVGFTLGNVQLSFTGSTATGTGIASASMTSANGGPACGFTSGAFVAVSTVPLAPPPGVLFPQGLADFHIGNCSSGASVTLTFQYPQAFPAGAAYWKFGPATNGASASWYILPGVSIVGNQVSYTLTDGQLGDDDWTVNGMLADPGGVAIGTPTTPVVTPAPVLHDWPSRAALALLMLVIATVMTRSRRTGSRATGRRRG